MSAVLVFQPSRCPRPSVRHLRWEIHAVLGAWARNLTPPWLSSRAINPCKHCSQHLPQRFRGDRRLRCLLLPDRMHPVRGKRLQHIGSRERPWQQRVLWRRGEACWCLLCRLRRAAVSLLIVLMPNPLCKGKSASAVDEDLVWHGTSIMSSARGTSGGDRCFDLFVPTDYALTRAFRGDLF